MAAPILWRSAAMHTYFWHFWWLVFPLSWFAFGAFGMWMRNQRHRDTLDLMKTLAAQGKDPSEIAKLLGEAPGPQPAGSWGGPYGWRDRQDRWGYMGPLREWRRTVIFACLAVGFGLGSVYADIPGTENAFRLVAIIMAVLAVGSFAFAAIATAMAAKARKNDG